MMGLSHIRSTITFLVQNGLMHETNHRIEAYGYNIG